MSNFAALMALSASQTRETQGMVESALLQRRRNEELKRKQQEERDKKQRELEAKLRLKHFEDEKKEQERQRKLQEERAAKERELKRREEEQRNALLYGPKKASSGTKWPTSSSGAREDVRRRRLPDDEDDAPAGLALTREELRERKLQAELKRTFQSQRRSAHTGGYSKAGKRLPGGAIDAASSGNPMGDSSSSGKSVKARIAALPNTLTKLNIVKRDTRTIDEILQDRAKARGDPKVLDGDEAREFNDWFGTSKKKEPPKRLTKSSTPAPDSGASTPASQSSIKAPTSSASQPLPPVKKASMSNSSKPSNSLSFSKTPASTVSKPSAPSKPSVPARPSTTDSSFFSKSSSKASASKPVLSKSVSFASRPPAVKKRPRSSSLSASPPPSKRRAASPGMSRNSISQEIWSLFGKDRGTYVQRDVLSDDEDMEADARALEREELRSSRIAKKEEELALEEERRHEEEKRRRRKEKDARQKGGY